MLFRSCIRLLLTECIEYITKIRLIRSMTFKTAHISWIHKSSAMKQFINILSVVLLMLTVNCSGQEMVDGNYVAKYSVSLFIPPGQIKNGKFKCPGDSTVEYVSELIGIHAVDFLQQNGVHDSNIDDWTGSSIAKVDGYTPSDFGERRLSGFSFVYKCRTQFCPKLTCYLCNPDNNDGRELSSNTAWWQRKFEAHVSREVLIDLKANCGKVNQFTFRYLGEM